MHKIINIATYLIKIEILILKNACISKQLINLFHVHIKFLNFYKIGLN